MKMNIKKVLLTLLMLISTSTFSFALEWNLWEVSKDIKRNSQEFYLFGTYKDLKTCEVFRNKYIDELKSMWNAIKINNRELEVTEINNKIVLKYKALGKELEERLFCATTALKPVLIK